MDTRLENAPEIAAAGAKGEMVLEIRERRFAGLNQLSSSLDANIREIRSTDHWADMSAYLPFQLVKVFGPLFIDRLLFLKGPFSAFSSKTVRVVHYMDLYGSQVDEVCPFVHSRFGIPFSFHVVNPPISDAEVLAP